MSDEARERWRAEHRRRRIHEKKWGPAKRFAVDAAFWLVVALAVGFGALGVFVAWGWGTLAFVFFCAALRIKGIRPFEGGGSDSYYSGPFGDSGGGDSGGSSS